jgi:hypothetical protein
MRRFWPVGLLASAVVMANVTVGQTGDQATPELPPEFQLLARGFVPSGQLHDTWSGLPFDRITLERTGSYRVTYYKRTDGADVWKPTRIDMAGRS